MEFTLPGAVRFVHMTIAAPASEGRSQQDDGTAYAIFLRDDPGPR